MTQPATEQDPEDIGIGLADMIMTLRSELLRAQRDPRSSELSFTTGPVQLQLAVAVTKKMGAKGGIRFWVIEAGGETEHSGLTTHSFNVTLLPTNPATNQPAQVAGTSWVPASEK